MQERFRRFAERTTATLGSVWVFTTAVVFTVLWGISGLLVGFSDTWQLTMNTVASIVAFLMVFVIQNTQSRDARAIHLKLDELLRSVDGARQHLVEVESLSDQEMEELREEFRAIHERALRDGGRAITGGTGARPSRAATRPAPDAPPADGPELPLPEDTAGGGAPERSGTPTPPPA